MGHFRPLALGPAAIVKPASIAMGIIYTVVIGAYIVIDRRASKHGRPYSGYQPWGAQSNSLINSMESAVSLPLGQIKHIDIVLITRIS